MSRRARNAERNVNHAATSTEKIGDIHDLRVANAPLVDDARLDEIRKIAADPQFLTRLVVGFRNDLTRLIASLSDVLNNSQLAQVSDVTHAIKGASLGIGAARLAAIAVELEEHSAAGRQDAAQAAYSRLQRCFDETSLNLETQIAHVFKAATR
jgi:HPt (histidine-containing phosphotransfer) domain-containing protein